jgi:hypothetical protein
VTPGRYAAFRDTLLELLDAARGLSVADPADPAVAGIGGIIERVRENRFEIALVGELQGGKSTTFNALCDGRSLAPTGIGIKTSGCLLSARHLSDPSAPEQAEITWREPGELVAAISDWLLPHLKGLDRDRFGDLTPEQLASVLDLNDRSDRRLLESAVEREWGLRDAVADHSGSWDSPTTRDLDTLRMAALLAAYHGTPELADQRGRATVPLSEAARIAGCPEDWETRWAARDPSQFGLDEIRFAFVRRLCLRIHSPNLSRLGCVITDCPGLLAGRWDSRVAREAVARADAIIYVADGGRPLKDSDLTALRMIRDHGLQEKLFFAWNLRGVSRTDGRRLMGGGLDLLKSHGWAVPMDRVAPFHARLAFQVARCRVLEAASTSAEELKGCRDEIRHFLSVLDGRNRPCLEAAAPVGTGGMDRLLGMVETEVVRRGARTVLIDGGARVAEDFLGTVERRLADVERIAGGREREIREEIAAAEAGLRRFIGDGRGAITHLTDDAPDDALADDLWARIVARREQVTETIVRRFTSEMRGLRKLTALLADRRFLEERGAGIIAAALDEALDAAVTAWAAEIGEGRNAVFRDRIGGRVRWVSRELARIWVATGLPETDWFSGISPPAFSGDLATDGERISAILADHRLYDGVRDGALTAAGLTGIFTATSGLLASALALTARVAWLGVASAGAALAGLVLLGLTRKMAESTLTETVRERTAPAVRALFRELEPEAKAAGRRFSKAVRDEYRAAFEAAVAAQRDELTARCRSIAADLERCRDDRVAKAAAARQVRETEIDPLRARLTEFIDAVVPLLPDEPNNGKGEANG